MSEQILYFYSPGEKEHRQWYVGDEVGDRRNITGCTSCRFWPKIPYLLQKG